jgi:3-deoxy-7-phosphoheptulonate synthase
VLWMCDPMHGNTYKLKSGYKTRDFDTIMNELESFFSIHHNLGTVPGGIHLEFTGEHVTECLGGTDNIIDNDLGTQYATACDPRLNVNQSLELAYRITKLLIKNKENNNV